MSGLHFSNDAYTSMVESSCGSRRWTAYPLAIMLVLNIALGMVAASLREWWSLGALSVLGFFTLYIGAATLLDGSSNDWRALAAARRLHQRRQRGGSGGDELRAEAAIAAGRQLKWRVASKVVSIVHASSLLLIAAWSLHRSATEEGMQVIADLRPLLQQVAASLGLAPRRDAAPISPVVSPGFAASYTAANADRETALLCYTLGYFILDTAHMLFWRVNDWAIVLHHVLVLAYAGTTLYIGHGAMSASLATVLGEATNPAQGVLWISLRLQLKRVTACASPLFAIGFITIRCFVSPIISAPLIWTFVNEGRATFAFFGWACFAINVGGVCWAVPLLQRLCCAGAGGGASGWGRGRDGGAGKERQRGRQGSSTRTGSGSGGRRQLKSNTD